VGGVGERIIIDRRFRGPPNSAQGGYACGLAAQHIEGPAEVRLLAPPPLETPLQLTRGEAGEVSLLDGDTLLVEARAASFDLEVPEPVTPAEAEAGSERCPWIERHPFPECFGCGPARAVGDGLRQFPGPVDGRDLFACVWTPDPSLADEHGLVRRPFMWAALDCPTAGPAVPLDSGPCVLAGLRARIEGPARVGQPHTVVAWAIEHDARRHRGGAAIHDADGRLCGASEGVWIELRDPAAMGGPRGREL
jgi:hypothetical protein